MEPSYSPPCPVCPSWYGSRSERKRRKKAAANIFQDVELGQVQALFRRSGDREAEERARIIWDQRREEEAGGAGLGQALMDLTANNNNNSRRRRRGGGGGETKGNKSRWFFHQNKNAAAEFLGLMWIKAFNKMR